MIWRHFLFGGVFIYDFGTFQLWNLPCAERSINGELLLVSLSHYSWVQSVVKLRRLYLDCLHPLATPCRRKIPSQNRIRLSF